MRKRGLSPIIATVLLISITFLLAIMVFAFFKNFIGESVTKFDEPVESACGKVNFDAEIFEKKISIVNRGNVPLYGVEIKKRGFGSVVEFESFTNTISSGETWSSDLQEKISTGDEVIILPTILGESSGDTKAFTCDEDFGIITTAV